MKRKFTLALCFHYLYHLRILFIGAISTFYCRLVLPLKGIKLGKNSSFIGIPITYVYPGSKITLGNNLQVRTSPLSNFIGINRKSIIATHDADAQIVLGDHCGLSGVVIGAKESITIGNHVMVGANVLITDFDWHSLDPSERSAGQSSHSRPVIIEDNVFIGYSSTVLKGVHIGKNAVIGANSVVTKNIPANAVAAGNPCRILSKTL
jgi:acetyltransferase-like isoleucine patch superfamily enzyme